MKSSGLGDGLLVQGYDFSGDWASIQDIGGGPSPLDTTDITKSAFARIGGLRDGRLNATSFFNPAAARAHPRLGSLPRTDVILTYLRSTVLAAPAACLNAKQANYDGTRGQDGAFTFTVNGLGNAYGLEWGKQMTAGVRTDTSATNGTGVDFGTGSTAFGLQAYLQVTAFTGTSVTIKLQESSDNGSGDAFTDVTGGGFTLVAGITAERIQTTRSLTVERYLRVVTTGTFSSVSFQVMANRNTTSTVF